MKWVFWKGVWMVVWVGGGCVLCVSVGFVWDLGGNLYVWFRNDVVLLCFE